MSVEIILKNQIFIDKFLIWLGGGIIPCWWISKAFSNTIGLTLINLQISCLDTSNRDSLSVYYWHGNCALISASSRILIHVSHFKLNLYPKSGLNTRSTTGWLKKNLTQNEININNTSDKNVSIKYAYTDRQNCFLSITKTITCFHCSVQKIWLFM